MDGAKYSEILEKNQKRSAKRVKMGWKFKHKVKATMKWLANNKVDILERLSQSPDLNPTENLWNYLKVAVHQWKSTNQIVLHRGVGQDLQIQVCQPWTALPKKWLWLLPKVLLPSIDSGGVYLRN